MFDITSSKLLLLAIVALLVIGPKDFPILLRTIGKYVGIIRSHAKEFRAQFDEAIRESELAQLKQEVETFAQETETSLNATKQSVEQGFDEARQGVEASLDANAAPAATPLAHDPDAAPTAPPGSAQVAEVAANGADEAVPGPDAPPAEQGPAASETVPAPATEKTGA